MGESANLLVDFMMNNRRDLFDASKKLTNAERENLRSLGVEALRIILAHCTTTTKLEAALVIKTLQSL